MQTNAAFITSETWAAVSDLSPEAPPDRDELVRKGMPIVRAVAERLRRRYTLSASFEDLCAMGLTGLAAAVDRFDSSRGAGFVTFAYHKIRGAILDGLRRSDRQYSFEMRCRQAAEREAELSADGDDIGMSHTDAAMGVANEQISARKHMLTIHLAAVSGASEERRTPDPDDILHQSEIRDRVQEAIASLPQKEREVIGIYYYCDGSFVDIAAKLGISRAWACRLHKRALTALRAALVDLEHDEVAEADGSADVRGAAGIGAQSKATKTQRHASADLVPSSRVVLALAAEAGRRIEGMNSGGEAPASVVGGLTQDESDSRQLGTDSGTAMRPPGRPRCSVRVRRFRGQARKHRRQGMEVPPALAGPATNTTEIGDVPLRSETWAARLSVAGAPSATGRRGRNPRSREAVQGGEASLIRYTHPENAELEVRYPSPCHDPRGPCAVSSVRRRTGLVSTSCGLSDESDST